MEEQAMKCVLFTLGVLATCCFQAQGASLDLLSGGWPTIDLAPGESVELDIIIDIRGLDSGFAFAAIFLDDDGNNSDGPIEVTALEQGLSGPDVVYDRGGFTLPADLSWDIENEYQLIMGRVDGENWGPGTYVLDTLTLTHTGSETSGVVLVTFEEGGRQPHVFTSRFISYIWTPEPPSEPFPNMLVPLTGAADNPFVINLVPPSEDCEGDANGDGAVDPLDSGFVLARFGCEVDAGDPECDAADQNGDGNVDPLDVGFILARFGNCP